MVDALINQVEHLLLWVSVMEEASLNGGLESLKRTVDETKSLLEQSRALLLDTFSRIEEVSRIAREASEHISAALEQLGEDPEDAAAQQTLEGYQALIEPLRESLRQYMAERDLYTSEICATTNALKVAERMVIEFSIEPGTTHF
ncbi:hypothetical protein [Leptolyngbya sp. FACHB-8]|uniref:hypothetical protein n=1 Tax=unclassified Leptolyngbya TaxID=2650499 RepID=UPI0016835574|nr:hypothetical protein [Leptolyngbya sp. FACHB-8]MBD1911279.1 hypothetical protein [Leptolyngbya sp. FACHB-8]